VGFSLKEVWITRYKLNSAQQINRFGKMSLRESVVMLEK
jgi:hypothetical protein